MAQQGAAQLYRKCGYEEEKRLVTEDPAMQNMNIVEKFIYSRVLNLYEFVLDLFSPFRVRAYGPQFNARDTFMSILHHILLQFTNPYIYTG